MDAFEARLQFSKMLSTLQPLSQSLKKATTFALRNYEFQDDFHQCILEVLNSANLIIKLSILNFIELLITQSRVMFTSKNPPYIENLSKDLPIIVAKIVPANKYGIYNLRMSFDILKNISIKLNFDNEKLTNYENLFFNGDLLTDELKNSKTFEPINIENFQGLEKSWDIIIDRKRLSQFITFKQDQYEEKEEENGKKMEGLTKEQITNRIEQDRERQKKSKESLWMVERLESGKVSKEEFRKLWERVGKIEEDDIKELGELNETALQSYNY